MEEVKSGLELIALERKRQIEILGFDLDHDDEHAVHELAWAAAAYTMPSPFIDIFPRSWAKQYDKRPRLPGEDLSSADALIEAGKTNERIRALVKAGALIAAEIDRLKRIETVNSKQTMPPIGAEF